MELVSICENLKKLGVPMPRFIDKALASMNEIIQNGSDKKESDDNGKAENETE
jgi:phage-related holin